MNLSAPQVVTFWIAVILVIVGVLAYLGTIPGFSAYAFGLVVVGFIVLALGNLVKGM